MKKIALTMILALFISAQAYAQVETEKVKDFALKLKSVIAHSDSDSFKNIPCETTDCTQKKYVLKRIFGGEEETVFEKIMRSPTVQIRILGPWVREDQEWKKENIYNIVFFDTENSPFSNKGKITDKMGVRELYESFLQTQVVISGSEVKFYVAAFYLGAHHPYVGEYGYRIPNNSVMLAANAAGTGITLALHASPIH